MRLRKNAAVCPPEEGAAGSADPSRRTVVTSAVHTAGRVPGPAPMVLAPAVRRLQEGGADDFLNRLRAEYETSAVPGRFFEMPDHIRVGMGVNHEMFVEGLKRFAQALGSGPL